MGYIITFIVGAFIGFMVAGLCIAAKASDIEEDK